LLIKIRKHQINRKKTSYKKIKMRKLNINRFTFVNGYGRQKLTEVNKVQAELELTANIGL